MKKLTTKEVLNYILLFILAICLLRISFGGFTINRRNIHKSSSMYNSQNESIFNDPEIQSALNN